MRWPWKKAVREIPGDVPAKPPKPEPIKPIDQLCLEHLVQQREAREDELRRVQALRHATFRERWMAMATPIVIEDDWIVYELNGERYVHRSKAPGFQRRLDEDLVALAMRPIGWFEEQLKKLGVVR